MRDSLLDIFQSSDRGYLQLTRVAAIPVRCVVGMEKHCSAQICSMTSARIVGLHRHG